MDASVNTDRSRHALLWIALAPLIPQLFGSVFNIWYNAVAINPLLGDGALHDRFFRTVILYNAIAYPAGVAFWLWCLLSLRPAWRDCAMALPFRQKRSKKRGGD